jgi:alpha-D-xyloside xylohydrolase
MKFTDGYWQLRQGVTAFHPSRAYDVEAARDRLTIYAPARPVRHRGDTLNNLLLTVEFWSPMPDVIGVRLSHFSGGRRGRYASSRCPRRRVR